MVDATISTNAVYIGAMILGIFTGIGSAVGNVIVKLWIEPKLQYIHTQTKDKKLTDMIPKLDILKNGGNTNGIYNKDQYAQGASTQDKPKDK